MVKKYNVESLKGYRPLAGAEMKPYVDEVVKLYVERKIEKVASAEKMMKKLTSNKRSVREAGVEMVKAANGNEGATGRLKNNVVKEYWMTAKVKTVTEYRWQNKKTKQWKTKSYEDTHMFADTIRAKSLKEAEVKLKWGWQQNNKNYEEYDGSTHKKTKEAQMEISGKEVSKSGTGEADTHMKAASRIGYEFFKEDDSHLQNNGYCVVDNFVARYQPHIPTLNRERFIDLCFEVLNLKKPYVSPLDLMLEPNDDHYVDADWSPSKGVTPNMLQKICEKLDISHYAFDVTNACFMKRVSRGRNYPALVYYCVNEHMYLISDKQQVTSMVRRARDPTVQMKTYLNDEEREKENIFSQMVIHENVPLEELDNYKDCIIIYRHCVYDTYKDSAGVICVEDTPTTGNLNRHVDFSIEKYDWCPKVWYKDSMNCVKIHFNTDERNLFLVVDPNQPHTDIDY